MPRYNGLRNKEEEFSSERKGRGSMDFKYNNEHDERDEQKHSAQTHESEQPAQQHPASETQEVHVQDDEPRTPYQTPVHSGSGYQSYEEWRRAQQMSNVRADNADPHGFSTYEEWQRQQQAMHQENGKGKKRHRRLFLTIGSIAAACMLLAAGVGIGSQLGSLDGGASASQGAPANDPNKPSLSISSTTSSSSGSDQGLTGEEVYEKVSPSVVSVVASNLATSGQSSGSGVIMSADGYVITNHHVIDGAQQVKVVLSDGMQYNASVVGSDEQTDLAVLKIAAEGKTFTPAEFGDSSKIKAGEKAFAIGSPGGVQLANTITTGSISAISRDITIDDRVMTLIQTDASINPGNSGGALINKYGQVIGITSAKLSSTGGINGTAYEGLGFAIPIDSAKEIIDELIQHGYVSGRPAIGVTGYNISEQTAQYNNVPQGVLITAVDTNSDAAKQGLQANDIITGVEGKTITTMDEINTAKKDLKAGDKLKLTIYRMSTGKTMNITITLADQHELAGNTSTQQQQQQLPQQGSGNYGGYYMFP